VLVAARVQGEDAPASIVTALRRVERWAALSVEQGRDGDAPVVTILARGGGSLEDLWAFNEEMVVRAVAAHPCPIVVGVGHETDVTLSEFAADVRAPTPSVAAELIVPARIDELARVNQLGARLNGALNQTLVSLRQQVSTEARALEARHPQAQITADRERVGVLLDRAARVVARRLEVERSILGRASDDLPALAAGAIAIARGELGRESAALNALSPYATLERGYSIVRGPNGAVLTDATAARAGDQLNIRLQRGEIGARVETVRDSPP
jgi:exodeoxyribonuclease VII large subunit